jgi:hypothetical protein
MMAGTAGGLDMRATFRRCGGKALALAALIAASSVLPSFAQDSSQRDLGRAREGTDHRYVFKSGVLQRDHLARWVLSDGTLLQTDDATVWIDEAAGNTLSLPIEGRSVRVMGQPGPDGLLVRHATLRSLGELTQAIGTAPESVPDQPEPVRPK